VEYSDVINLLANVVKRARQDLRCKTVCPCGDHLVSECAGAMLTELMDFVISGDRIDEHSIAVELFDMIEYQPRINYGR
jgi:hypothetical protein